MTLTDFVDLSHRGPELLPLDAGEHYRFSFDMGACIGCHSCEVACAEQNGNPVDVNWRRVGEIEGGEFPNTRRFHLSMTCNHCLDPACLNGCPTNAYVKLDNGIVAHHAEDCIGCRYCMWNCPYGAPVYNAARKIVTKCDLCRPRLDTGDLPACVLACPTEAIKVEKVHVDSWLANFTSADGPNLPSAAQTISTTRIVLPERVPFSTFAGSDHDLRPEDPHWPLIVLTLLTQFSVGTLAATAIVRPGRSGAEIAFVTAAVALAAALFHLGRPIAAWKAFRNLRQSWLSREVALFAAFSGLAALYALTPSRPLAAAAVAVGVAGIYASARLYLVPARPAWNSWHTVAAFFLTSAAIGPLCAAVLLDGSRSEHALTVVAAAATVGQLLVHLAHVAALASHDGREYRGSIELLVHRFRGIAIARAVAVIVALVMLAAGFPLVALAAGLVRELLARYQFYVTVVPMSMPSTFALGRN